MFICIITSDIFLNVPTFGWHVIPLHAIFLSQHFNSSVSVLGVRFPCRTFFTQRSWIQYSQRCRCEGKDVNVCTQWHRCWCAFFLLFFCLFVYISLFSWQSCPILEPSLIRYVRFCHREIDGHEEEETPEKEIADEKNVPSSCFDGTKLTALQSIHLYVRRECGNIYHIRVCITYVCIYRSKCRRKENIAVFVLIYPFRVNVSYFVRTTYSSANVLCFVSFFLYQTHTNGIYHLKCHVSRFFPSLLLCRIYLEYANKFSKNSQNTERCKIVIFIGFSPTLTRTWLLLCFCLYNNPTCCSHNNNNPNIRASVVLT